MKSHLKKENYQEIKAVKLYHRGHKNYGRNGRKAEIEKIYIFMLSFQKILKKSEHVDRMHPKSE